MRIWRCWQWYQKLSDRNHFRIRTEIKLHFINSFYSKLWKSYFVTFIYQNLSYNLFHLFEVLPTVLKLEISVAFQILNATHFFNKDACVVESIFRSLSSFLYSLTYWICWLTNTCLVVYRSGYYAEEDKWSPSIRRVIVPEFSRFKPGTRPHREV